MPTFPNTNQPDELLYIRLAEMMLLIENGVLWPKIITTQADSILNPKNAMGEMLFPLPKEIAELQDVVPSLNPAIVGDTVGSEIKFAKLLLDKWKRTNPANSGVTTKDRVTHDVDYKFAFFKENYPQDIVNHIDTQCQLALKNMSYRTYGDITKPIFDPADKPSHGGVFSTLYTALKDVRAPSVNNFFVINAHELGNLDSSLRTYQGSGVVNNLANPLPANQINGLTLVSSLLPNEHVAGDVEDTVLAVEGPITYPERSQVISVTGENGTLNQGDIIWFGSDSANTHVVTVGNTWTTSATKSVTISPGLRDVIPATTVINILGTHCYSFALNKNALGLGGAPLMPAFNGFMSSAVMNSMNINIPVTYIEGVGYNQDWRELDILYGFVELMSKFVIRVVSKKPTSRIAY